MLDAGPNCKLAIKTPHLFLVQEDIAIAVNLIDAPFLPYEQVIPNGAQASSRWIARGSSMRFAGRS